MPIANCKRCGRIYNRVRRDVCVDCIREEDEILVAIRTYLKTHPDATIHQVSEDTDIAYGVIMHMIQDGRLLLRDNPNMKYPCERCKKPTSSGRLCAACSKELAQGFGDASETIRAKRLETDDGKGGFLSH